MIIDSSDHQSKIEKYISANIGSDYQYYLAKYDKNFIKYKISDICYSPESKLFGIIKNSKISVLGKFLPLKWDTSFFNFKVGKISDIYGSKFNEKLTLLKEIKSFAKINGYKLIICRVDASDISSIHALEEIGFKWVDGMNILLNEYNKTPLEYHADQQKDVNISVVSKDEVVSSEKIKELVISFAKNGRLNNDPKFSSDQVRKFYISLFESLVKKDNTLMIITKKNENIIGFALGMKDTLLGKFLKTSIGYLWMISIDENASNKGIGRRLFQEFINEFSNNIQLIEVGTQMNNYAALNL